jgi:ubiquitin-protein ligase
MFRVRLSGLDEVFRFPLDKSSTIHSICKLVQSEFNLSTPLTAAIYGSPLDPDSLVQDLIQPSDVITLSKIDNSPFSDSSLARFRPTPIPDGHVRVFSSLSIHSLIHGDDLPINDHMTASNVLSSVTSLLNGRYSRLLPPNPLFQLFLPGGAIYEKGTIGEFRRSFPHFCPHLYVVITRSIDAVLLTRPVGQIVRTDANTKPLLSPFCDATDLSYSMIACFLGYIANDGQLSEEIIYGLSKYFPFAPMINGLSLLLRHEQVTGSFITQITAPLFTIVTEVFKTSEFPGCSFEKLLDFIRFVGQTRYVMRLHCTIFKKPFLRLGYELFFDNYNADIIPMLDIDFRDLDFVQLKFNPTPDAIQAATAKIPMLVPISIMSARRQNRVCFVLLRSHIGLFLNAVAAKLHEQNPEKRKQLKNARDRICIIDPARGEPEEHDPETLAKAIGVQDIGRILDIQEVSEFVFVAIDCSGSMSIKFDGGQDRFFAARDFFRRFAEQAYRFGVVNFYGLCEFGCRDDDLPSIVQELTPITSDFQRSFDSVDSHWDSPMWEAIQLSADRLLAKARDFPRRPLRIIVLSDGASKGNRTLNQTLPVLLTNQIHLDAIIISKSDMPRGKQLEEFGDLITAVRMTGGYAFVPKTIEEGLRIFEDEAFFNPTIREYSDPQPANRLQEIRQAVSADRAPAQADQRMRSKPIEVMLSNARKFADVWWILANLAGSETFRDVRLIEELQYIAGNCNPTLEVFVNVDDISEWRVMLKVVEESRYPNSWFQLFLKFPDLYPANGPLIRLFHPPYHASVSDQGRLKLVEVQEYYDESIRVFEIVEEVRLLLQKEDITEDDAIDDARASVVAIRQDGVPVEYDRRVSEWHDHNKNEDWTVFTGGWELRRLPVAEKGNIEVREASPRQYICPISRKLMRDPVKSPTTGYYYDKSALQSLLARGKEAACPITGKIFMEVDHNLEIDPSMKQRIREFSARNG